MKANTTAIAIVSLALLAGCEDKTAAPATKPATPPPAATGPAAPKSGGPIVNSPMGQMPPPAAAPAAITPGQVSIAGITFKVPEGWKQVPPSNQMRLAEIQVPDASGDPARACTIAFSMAGGDPKANIQRWAGQVTDASGNPSTPQVTERTVQGIKVTVAEMTGSYTNTMGNEPKRDNWMMRGAILEGVTPDQALFIKMTGPADRMAAAGPQFSAMIDSLKKQ